MYLIRMLQHYSIFSDLFESDDTPWGFMDHTVNLGWFEIFGAHTDISHSHLTSGFSNS